MKEILQSALTFAPSKHNHQITLTLDAVLDGKQYQDFKLKVQAPSNQDVMLRCFKLMRMGMQICHVRFE